MIPMFNRFIFIPPSIHDGSPALYFLQQRLVFCTLIILQSPVDKQKYIL